jgi:cytochrome P450
MSSVDDSFADPGIARCPFDHYKMLRADAPAHMDPVIGFVWLTRRADVTGAALDSRTFRSQSDIQLRKSFQPKAQQLWDEAGIKPVDTLVTSDPPMHDDYRRLGMSLFGPKRVALLQPKIEETVNSLIDGFIDEGRCDFVKQFAALLPATIICDEYRMPPEDRARFKHWTDAAIGIQTPGISEEEEAEFSERLIKLFYYLEACLKAAADGEPGSAIHTLATFNRKDGTPFTWMERASMTQAVFVGGNETTVNMLSSSILLLCNRPDIQHALRDDPGLIDNFVEEILRLQPSVQALIRVADVDTEVAGVRIAKETPVVLSTGSANRDERFWEDPDSFRLDRTNGRQHYTFGYGRHVCIGMHLARRELKSALRILLERLDDIRLEDPARQPEYLPLPFFRGLAEVSIRFEKKP